MLVTTLATLAVRRSAERALPSDAGTPRKEGRRGPDLRHQVEVPRLSTRKWLHLRNFQRFESELGRGTEARFLLFRLTVTLPCNQRPTGRQQRRGVFRDHRERRERTSAGELEAADPLGPVLGSGPDDISIGHAGSHHRPFEELAF